MKNVVILGAGGHAKVVAEIITKAGNIVVGFLDDNLNIQNSEIYKDKKVLGLINDCVKFKDCFFIIAIGNNEIRKNISKKYNLKWYTAIHPCSTIADDVEIGEGTVIMPGVVINSGTKIGNHCIINTSSSLDHDDFIEHYVHVSPGAHLAGAVIVGEKTWIGAGATIINNININKNNIIGAGATVVQNIDDTDNTYVGVPAKKIER